MADKLTPKRRSANMAAIRSKNTSPEMIVRSTTHRLGHRFRLHGAHLPGKPDLVFGPKRKVIFVHGCFWHCHEREGCLDARLPKSNTSYWSPKLLGNKERDARHVTTLQAAGWKVLTIWECETRDVGLLAKRITRFLR